MPRTYLGILRPSERTPESSKGLIDWVWAMYKLPDTYVLQHHSLDAYLVLRYLKLITVICFVGCLITWPILFPVNATGGGGKQQLDMLSFSNIALPFSRFYAHTFVAWIFIAFIFFMITRESIYYINLRQAYALSPAYASRTSSRTVIFSSVPGDYLNVDKIRTMFGPEKVKNVWLATDTSKLEEKVKERDDVAMKLESAEIALIRAANGERLKSLKKGAHATEEEAHQTENPPEDHGDDESGSAAARWINTSKRPTHRLTLLIGKKVDTINWARSELERLNPEIEELQARHRAGNAKLVSSVFVEFYAQGDAQAAFQSVAHNLPMHMSPRYIGLKPNQVVWSNLRIQWWERVIRNAATISCVVALIIFWAIPVAVVGSISNINFLIQKVPFLSFINSVPSVILGVITGLLPSVLLAVLMALLPIVLRLMAKFGGVPTTAAIELRTQNFYFAFQVVQVFLVITVASSASSVVVEIIDQPSSAPQLLANNLPKASNFYISYLILQGLTFTSGALLQIVGLIVGKLLGMILDNSPRKMFKRWASLSGLGWGTILPPMSLLAVIAITYSCIAPLVLGFATIGLYLFYFAYRYNFLYVSDTDIDTQGMIYPRALQHLTVGCYLLIVCLTGLFAIGTGSDKLAVGPMILMIIFLVFTILYHLSLNQALTPLLTYLPKNLEAEEEALLSRERADNALPEGSTAQNGVTDDSAERARATSTVETKPNLITKFLRPDKYASYAILRRLIPADLEIPTYTPEVERDAYFHPSITAQQPLLWVPRDDAGVSRQEVRHTSRVNPITDEDAWLDKKNKIHWDTEKGKAPIYVEKIVY